jgi:hypothetical protein
VHTSQIIDLKSLHINELIPAPEAKLKKVMIERIDPERYHISGMGIMHGYLKVVERDASVSIDDSLNAHAEDVFG